MIRTRDLEVYTVTTGQWAVAGFETKWGGIRIRNVPPVPMTGGPGRDGAGFGGRGVSHHSLRMERQLLRLMVSSGLNILATSLPGTSRHGRRIALPALHLFTSADRFF